MMMTTVINDMNNIPIKGALLSGRAFRISSNVEQMLWVRAWWGIGPWNPICWGTNRSFSKTFLSLFGLFDLFYWFYWASSRHLMAQAKPSLKGGKGDTTGFVRRVWRVAGLRGRMDPKTRVDTRVDIFSGSGFCMPLISWRNSTKLLSAAEQPKNNGAVVDVPGWGHALDVSELCRILGHFALTRAISIARSKWIRITTVWLNKLWMHNAQSFHEFCAFCRARFRYYHVSSWQWFQPQRPPLYLVAILQRLRNETRTLRLLWLPDTLSVFLQEMLR